MNALSFGLGGGRLSANLPKESKRTGGTARTRCRARRVITALETLRSWLAA